MKVTLVNTNKLKPLPFSLEVDCILTPFNRDLAQHHFVAIVIFDKENYNDLMNECVAYENKSNINAFLRKTQVNRVHPKLFERSSPMCEELMRTIQLEAQPHVPQGATYDIYRLIIIYPSLFDVGTLKYIVRCCFGQPDPMHMASNIKPFKVQMNQVLRKYQLNKTSISMEVQMNSILYKHGDEIARVIKRLL